MACPSARRWIDPSRRWPSPLLPFERFLGFSFPDSPPPFFRRLEERGPFCSATWCLGDGGGSWVPFLIFRQEWRGFMSLALSSKKAPECGTERNAAGCKVQKPDSGCEAGDIIGALVEWKELYRAPRLPRGCAFGFPLNQPGKGKSRYPPQGWFKGKPRGHPQFLGSQGFWCCRYR